jgi:hypothetical protein
MGSDDADGEVVKTGTWLYANEIPCDVRIVRTEGRPGSGDYEDPPELREDQPGAWFRVDFAAAGERGSFSVGGGYWPALDVAMREAERVVPGPIRWDQ